MTTEAPLLIEVGTEELPPSHLEKHAQAFAQNVSEKLEKLGFSPKGCEYFCTPRRLACRINGITTTQPDQTIERKGPALNAAFDDNGQPKPAAIGFAKSCGTTIEKLEKIETSKGSWLSFQQHTKGQALESLLPEIVEACLNALKFKKRMRWNNHEFAFARPIHWVCVLLGGNHVKFSVFNIKTQPHSFGHRTHAPAPLDFKDAFDYESALKKAFVMVSATERQQAIINQSNKIAESINGNVVFAEGLLNTLTHLVEWPVPLLGKFGAEFLKVPAEALISSMQDHQKCLPIRDRSGDLLPNFIMVSNLESPPYTEIISGNERVMCARLKDAAFFFAQDQKTELEDHVNNLKKMTFQNKLGSLYDKTIRCQRLAAYLAPTINADVNDAKRAAFLSKADLLTHMVYEFPELQGIMGNHYAKIQGEKADIGQAIEQAYWPKFAKDQLPQSPLATTIALAERLDTLVGIFGIGLHPTGDKDPFGLRRAALGALRIILENELNIDLLDILNKACELYGDIIANDTAQTVLSFCYERLTAWYSEKGLDSNILDAVLSNHLTKPIDIHQRLMAVKTFKTLPEAQSLAQANKRVRNILNKNKVILNVNNLAAIDKNLLQEEAEKNLASELFCLEDQISQLAVQGKYEESLKLLANLQKPVDAFFDSVMVMADDPKLQHNRIVLLSHLSAIFLKIADVSRLAI